MSATYSINCFRFGKWFSQVSFSGTRQQALSIMRITFRMGDYHAVNCEMESGLVIGVAK